jgi:hypothetical protein
MKKLVGGGIFIFFGLFMLLGFFASTTPSSFIVNVMMLLVMVFAPIVTGVLLIRSHYLTKNQVEQQSRKNILASREKEILRLAKIKNGELTIPEIVSDTSMNAEEADEIMRELVVKQFVDMRITDQGMVIYEFFDLKKDVRNDPIGGLESWTDDRDVN